MIDQIVPDSFIIEKFYEHAGYPRYKKTTDVYEGGCPLCREGDSWGRKRRLYYIVKNNNIFCHNCGWSGTPLKWIAEIEGVSKFDVIKEAKSIDYVFQPKDINIDRNTNLISLPGDCINLYDVSQLNFYNKSQKIKDTINYIRRRRLDTAINKPKSLWFCKEDKIHKNRLIIPFYENKKILFYQSRTLFSFDKKPKYISKIDADKTLFNIDNIDSSINSIFIFEGPIDSFFIKNGISVGGIQKDSTLVFTSVQEYQINKFTFYNKIWVLDNQFIDNSARVKTNILLKEGHTCFIWPKFLKEFKDFNDICVKGKRDFISPQFVINNSFKGLEGIMKLKLTTSSSF